MSVQTRGQRLARAAYERIALRRPDGEYAGFAKRFPSLVHSCGLAQAVAFALAKKGRQLQYLEDLTAVLTAGGHERIATPNALAGRSREVSAARYLRLSRDALEAAVWLKRYVEAAEPSSPAVGDSEEGRGA